MIILFILFLIMLIVFIYGGCEVASIADDEMEKMFWNWKEDKE